MKTLTIILLALLLTACGGSADPIEPSIDGPSDETAQPATPTPVSSPQCQTSGVCS